MKNIFQSIIKIGLFISIIHISCFNSFAQNKISLDEDWRFHFGNSADPNKDFNYSGEFYVLMVFFVVMFIWSAYLARATFQFITYYSTASFYFSSNRNEEGEAQVVTALKLAYFKHLGSICLGSAIHVYTMAIRKVIEGFVYLRS